MIKINKGKRFQQAVDSVEDYLKKAKGKEQVRLGGRSSTRCWSPQYIFWSSQISKLGTKVKKKILRSWKASLFSLFQTVAHSWDEEQSRVCGSCPWKVIHIFPCQTQTAAYFAAAGDFHVELFVHQVLTVGARLRRNRMLSQKTISSQRNVHLRFGCFWKVCSSPEWQHFFSLSFSWGNSWPIPLNC